MTGAVLVLFALFVIEFGAVGFSLFKWDVPVTARIVDATGKQIPAIYVRYTMFGDELAFHPLAVEESSDRIRFSAMMEH